MNKIVLFTTIIMLTLSCTSKDEPLTKIIQVQNTYTHLTLKEANRLSKLPLKCIEQEFPNKLGQVLTDSSDLKTPKDLHPAFYGCFDWHSSVHGHWSLVKLLKVFPELDNKNIIVEALQKNMSKENIAKEVAYFNQKQSYSYERTYGWAWLLKLALEIKTWDSPIAKGLDANLQPLTDLLVERYIEFLPKLNYPLRVGTHNNTAFGLSFAYDYALETNTYPLQDVIKSTAIRLYKDDTNYQLKWEPSGTDFLSPAFEEIGIMEKVLSKNEFLIWLNIFMPELKNDSFELTVAQVSDRTDGHLVHLDGLNFSRAWQLYKLAKKYPKELSHLKNIADKHIEYSLPSIVDGSYEGEHWLATFALYALSEK